MPRDIMASTTSVLVRNAVLPRERIRSMIRGISYWLSPILLDEISGLHAKRRFVIIDVTPSVNPIWKTFAQ